MIAADATLLEEHGLHAPPPTELNPFRQPLDAAAALSGGALDVPWMANGWLTGPVFGAGAPGAEVPAPA